MPIPTIKQLDFWRKKLVLGIRNLKIISPPNWKLRQRKIPSENIGDSTSLPNSVSQGCTEVAQKIRGQCWFSSHPNVHCPPIAVHCIVILLLCCPFVWVIMSPLGPAQRSSGVRRLMIRQWEYLTYSCTGWTPAAADRVHVLHTNNVEGGGIFSWLSTGSHTDRFRFHLEW